MEELNALDTGFRNGLEVFCDTFLSYAAVEEMEPSLGIEDAVGMKE
jgi:hypothetical protein